MTLTNNTLQTPALKVL